MHTITALVLTIAFGLAPRLGRAAEPTVQFEGDRVTIRASDVAAGDLVAAIAAACGAAVHGSVAEPERLVRADMDARPTQEALGRVLGSQPFSLRYDVQGRLRSIVLMGTSPTGARVTRVARDLQSPIALGGDLARSLGEAHAPFDQVVDTAIRGTDAGARSDAARAALETLDADAALRTRFLETYASVRPEVAASAMSSLPGGHEFIRYLATNSRSPDLRGRAQAVLAAIQAGPPQ